jgi:hypothetical protein
LNAKSFRPAKIHCQLVEVYGEGVMNKGNVHKWCHLFNGGRTDVHNEMQSGYLSVITKDLKDGVDAHVCENWQFTIDELHEVFPYVPRSVLYEIVTVKLRYKKKLMPDGFQECSQLNTTSYGLVKWTNS